MQHWLNDKPGECLDSYCQFVHVSCMATKTITLEIDAYERLRAQKKPGESFSAVVRRLRVVNEAPTGRDLLNRIDAGGAGVSAGYLDEVEAAVAHDRPPEDPWN